MTYDAGVLPVSTGALRLTPLADGRVLLEQGRRPVLAFWPLGRGDCADGADTTLSVDRAPTAADGGLVWESVGARFRRRHVLRATADSFMAWVELAGEGVLTDLWLWGEPERPLWPVFGLRYNPEPNSDRRPFGSAAEPATVDVTSDRRRAGGDWFFCPAPFCFAFQAEGGSWLAIGLAEPIARSNFVAFEYTGKPAPAFRVRYDGHQPVRGRWRSPTLIGVAASSPHEAVDAYAEALRRLGHVPVVRRGSPDWWREPAFCGWGEQVNRHRSPRWHGGLPPKGAADYCTEAQYEDYLEILAGGGVFPGTVVVDDRWQRAYGDPAPEPSRWPNLRAFVGRRHAAGQRVLLWLKLWDPAGVPPGACILDPAGRAVAVDPTSPAYVELLTRRIQALLGAGVDGFKLDFHHLTPLGAELRPAEPIWGAALLHRLCRVVYEAAKAGRPDALIISQAANPAFADTLDAIRLNDVASSDQPCSYVASMVDRARVAVAACPDALVDCDNWPSPNRATCLEYLESQPDIGVPSLYYASGVCWQDIHGGLVDEPFRWEDYSRIAATWARYRAAAGLPTKFLV
ncbi:MAG: hypothetical protein HY331_10670 [Chloroflexi bacterium]|nr:hypothetical protein [Chloroflexota bacterium]